MKRIGILLFLCVLLSFGLNLNGAWAFSKKPSLPFSKEPSSLSKGPLVLSVTEDISARSPHSKQWQTKIKSNKSSIPRTSGYTEIRPGLHVLTSDSEYQNAEATLTATPDGAEAKRLSHPVRFKSLLFYGRPTVEQGDPKSPAPAAGITTYK